MASPNDEDTNPLHAGEVINTHTVDIAISESHSHDLVRSHSIENRGPTPEHGAKDEQDGVGGGGEGSGGKPKLLRRTSQLAKALWKPKTLPPKEETPEGWDAERVATWLDTIGLNVYHDNFVKNLVDGEVLLQLTLDELKDDLGIGFLHDRKTIMTEIHNLKKMCGRGIPPLPTHGKILCHLSNIRTYHSWIRIAITCVSLGIVVSKLVDIKGAVVFVVGVFYTLLGLISVLYGFKRYGNAITMIEDDETPFQPDKVGPAFLTAFIALGALFASLLIVWDPAASDSSGG